MPLKSIPKKECAKGKKNPLCISLNQELCTPLKAPCPNALELGGKTFPKLMVSQRLPYQVQTADKFPPTTNKKTHCAQILSADTSLTGVTPSSVLHGYVAALNTVLYEHLLDTSQISTQDEVAIAARLFDSLARFIELFFAPIYCELGWFKMIYARCTFRCPLQLRADLRSL